MVTNNISKIIDQVYKENVFSSTEKKLIFSRVDFFMKSLNNSLKKHKVDADIFLGGSSAKGTSLKKGFDSDIFIRFDYKKYKEFSSEISDIAHQAVFDATSGLAERVHGSRDYFIFRDTKETPNLVFEMIPVLNIDKPEKALNITDVSPLHVIWAKKHIGKKSYVVKDIIATKLFLKAIGAYGAESYIRGFSGHDVDILLLFYGSFEALLKSAVTWEKKQIIDVEKHYKSNEEVFCALNPSKISPLILIDPIQPERNAAASLSVEKFELFKNKALEFLAEPKKSYFIKKSFSLTNLKNRKVKGCKKIIFKAKSLEGKRDVVGSKLLKVYEHIRKKMKSSSFHIVESDWYWDESKVAYFWFFITNESISFIRKNPYIIHKGPPLKRKTDAAKFKEKHSDVYEENSFLFTRVKREFLSIEELLNFIVKEKYVVERVIEINLIYRS